MLQHPTLDRLNAMGLAGMARAFGELTANAEAERLTHPEWLALLLDREWSFRHDRKLAARLRLAKLRHQAAPEDVDYRSTRGLDRALFLTSADSGLRAWGLKLRERIGFKRAAVAVAQAGRHDACHAEVWPVL